MQMWVPFIADCFTFIDSDGTYRHWKYSSSYAEEPWIDRQIYEIIRAKYLEIQKRIREKEIRKAKNKKRR